MLYLKSIQFMQSFFTNLMVKVEIVIEATEQLVAAHSQQNVQTNMLEVSKRNPGDLSKQRLNFKMKVCPTNMLLFY